MIEIDMVESGEGLGMPAGEHVAGGIRAEPERLRVADLTEQHAIAGRGRLANECRAEQSASLPQDGLHRNELEE